MIKLSSKFCFLQQDKTKAVHQVVWHNLRILMHNQDSTNIHVESTTRIITDALLIMGIFQQFI